MAGRGVRGADPGVLRKAARATAARAAPGPAEPRQRAAALPGSCIRPGRRRVPGHRRAGTWPAALASGASPRPTPRAAAPRPPDLGAAARMTATSTGHRPAGPGKEHGQGIIGPNLMASDTRRGSPAGSPAVRSPGASRPRVQIAAIRTASRPGPGRLPRRGRQLLQLTGLDRTPGSLAPCRSSPGPPSRPGLPGRPGHRSPEPVPAPLGGDDDDAG